MDIQSKLEEELTRILDKLGGLEPESNEYKAVLTELSQLMGRDIEYKKLALDTKEKANSHKLAKAKLDADSTEKSANRALEEKKLAYEQRKLEIEANDKKATRETEAKLKKVQLRDERMDKILRNGISVLTWGGSLAAGIGIVWAAFTYEEEGTIASPIGRKIIGMFLPKW